MKTRGAILLLLFLFPLVVQAQALCDFLPCGPIPWSIPALPVLVSPSPMPTIGITLAPTGAPTNTPEPTNTPAPTSTVMTDFTNLGDQLSTLQAEFNATPIPIEVSGTPIDPNEQLSSMAGDAFTFFGYVRGFSEVSLGGLTPIISFILVAFATVISVKVFGFLLPMLATIFGLIFRIVQFVIGLFKV